MIKLNLSIVMSFFFTLTLRAGNILFKVSEIKANKGRSIPARIVTKDNFPKEPISFAKDARINLRPPDFKDATILVTEGKKVIVNIK